MKVLFVVLEPESKRGTYEVPLPIVVGRGTEARFRIQQDRISRKHCELFDRDGDVYVRDLGSTNGTFLDGEQIAASIRTPVPPGSVLRVGTIDIRIDYEGSGRLARAAKSAPAGAEDATIGFAPVEEAEPEQGFPSFDGSEPAAAAEFPELALEGASQKEAIPEESLELEEEPLEPAEPAERAPVAVFPALPETKNETQKAPAPGNFGDVEVEEPAIEAFTAEGFDGAASEAAPAADGSFDFLAGSKDERPADDAQLGDFFKGLK